MPSTLRDDSNIELAVALFSEATTMLVSVAETQQCPIGTRRRCEMLRKMMVAVAAVAFAGAMVVADTADARMGGGHGGHGFGGGFGGARFGGAGFGGARFGGAGFGGARFAGAGFGGARF